MTTGEPTPTALRLTFTYDGDSVQLAAVHLHVDDGRHRAGLPAVDAGANVDAADHPVT